MHGEGMHVERMVRRQEAGLWARRFGGACGALGTWSILAKWVQVGMAWCEVAIARFRTLVSAEC